MMILGPGCTEEGHFTSIPKFKGMKSRLNAVWRAQRCPMAMEDTEFSQTLTDPVLESEESEYGKN